jgi:hypothetical protein
MLDRRNRVFVGWRDHAGAIVHGYDFRCGQGFDWSGCTRRQDHHARETDTGQTRTVITGSDGAYGLDAMLVGNYSVTAEASGFRTEVLNGLTLTVAQAAAANFTRQVGQATQTVSPAQAALIMSTRGTARQIQFALKVIF